MQDNKRGIGDNSTQDVMPSADTSTGLIAAHEGRYDDMLQQALRFIKMVLLLQSLA